MDSLQLGNVKDFVNQLALIGLEQIGGEPAILEMLQSERESGHIDRHKYKKFRDKILALQENAKKDKSVEIKL